MTVRSKPSAVEVAKGEVVGDEIVYLTDGVMLVEVIGQEGAGLAVHDVLDSDEASMKVIPKAEYPGWRVVDPDG